MSREILDGGPSRPGHVQGRDRRVEADDESHVLELSAHPDSDDIAAGSTRHASRPRVTAGVSVLVLALAVGWTVVGRSGETPQPASGSTPAASTTPTSGWFAYSGSGYSSNLTLQAVPEGITPLHARYVGTFPPTPTAQVTVYRLTAGRGTSAPPPKLARQSLIAAANLATGSADLLTTTDRSTGLDTYAIENPPPHSVESAPLKVTPAAAVDLARSILVAVGADPSQWRITTSSRIGDGWSLDLTLVFPGLEDLAALSPVAGALPHGTLVVTTPADAPAARPHSLAVQAMDLTSGYWTSQETVDVRPVAETFQDLSAGHFRMQPDRPVPRADRVYGYAAESVALVPAPSAGRWHDQDGYHPAHLLVPAWVFAPGRATADPGTALLASAVPPDTRLTGVPAGKPYVSNLGS